MRKNDLIKMLQDIKGNPEIVMWNGFVRDYQHLDKQILPYVLVRETREFVTSALNNEAIRDGDPPPTEADIDEAMSYRGWEEPNPYVKPEEFERWYGKKKKVLYVLQGKRRHKTYSDRLGQMEY